MTPKYNVQTRGCKFPRWTFCTTVEDLPEDYELHYSDQVVTYRDLRTWLSNVDDYMPE